MSAASAPRPTSRLSARFLGLVPFGTALAAVFADRVPLPLDGLSATGGLSLCVAVYWSLVRPDLLHAGAVFVLGLVYDALAGLPLGMTSLVLLLVRRAVVGQRRFLLSGGFLTAWASFASLAVAAETLRWLLAGLYFGELFPHGPLVAPLVLSVLLYPAVSWTLSHLASLLPPRGAED